ncbi:ADP-ribosylglycohydrolase family protein [Verrucomicrobia bacterium]|nr:ADP-ribosylglycohydrolase family protein [bacterium]MDB4798035.1 ADP-ribosylglycohydrolase family protein [Verrucomicrobiota bacterium]
MDDSLNIRRAQIEGCLLGCAVGDSVCLPYEGMSARRVNKFVRAPLQHRFFFGRGMVSDDTDHSIFVAQALSRYPTDPMRFSRALAWRFRFWLLCLPAGIGLATLKSILRLWLGIPPSRSGIFSAGNGAAMRSAVIGVCHSEDHSLRRKMVSASSRITHSDPRGDYGAQAIAALASVACHHVGKPELTLIESVLLDSGKGEEWREVVQRTLAACSSGAVENAVAMSDRERGVSGYIYHTLPVAVAAWYVHFGDFRRTIESTVRLGGDTDTVAAIAGSLAGVSSAKEGIPGDWIVGIYDCPHSASYISSLARALDEGDESDTRFSWMLFPRGLIFMAIVLAHGVRRLFPPY